MNGLWNSMLSFSESKVHLRIGRFFRDFEIEFGTPCPQRLRLASCGLCVEGP